VTDNITLPRAVAEEAARFIDSPNTRLWPAGTQYRLWKAFRTALDAALAEPEPDAIARAVEAEREACAKVCESEGARIDASWTSCAAAIRARGSK